MFIYFDSGCFGNQSAVRQSSELNFIMPHVVPLKATEEETEKFIENSPFSWWLNAGQTKLPPEVERDNVEYKVNEDLFEVILIICFVIFVFDFYSSFFISAKFTNFLCSSF